MKICRADGYRVMPWKNGGGSTTEMAIAPDGASLDDFDWRLSMARIEADGPFSAFPGIDRTLTLLEGPTVSLQVNERAVTLNPDQPTIAFAGEDRVSAMVPTGPITDFNVMTRRARHRHSLTRLHVSGELAIARTGATTILFQAEGTELTCRSASAATATLGHRDALILDGGDPTAWRLEAATTSTVYKVEIS